MKTETRSERIEARIFPTLKTRADAVATAKNKSLSELVVDLLTKEVENHEQATGKKSKAKK